MFRTETCKNIVLLWEMRCEKYTKNCKISVFTKTLTASTYSCWPMLCMAADALINASLLALRSNVRSSAVTSGCDAAMVTQEASFLLSWCTMTTACSAVYSSSLLISLASSGSVLMATSASSWRNEEKIDTETGTFLDRHFLVKVKEKVFRWWPNKQRLPSDMGQQCEMLMTAGDRTRKLYFESSV